ncbi:tyrosine-protein phosphatase non-receptor type 23 [Dendroctonus ponderosae]
MEAAPRLPMISFGLFVSQETVQFGKKLKEYIAAFYHEDPESYTAEISKLDALRASAAHPTLNVSGLETLKKYYCQLHFLKSRFPMEPGQPCFIEFEWKDSQNGSSSGGIEFELMAILHNIGVLHTVLGAQDSRTNPEGMKLACSHFQCAIWVFQTLKERYSVLSYLTFPEVPHFYKQLCLAQAQECILEKSMLDNRKSTIISKVAVQVWDYYRQALSGLKSISDDSVGRNRYKDWMKYLQFKIAYHRCISLLFQGQQAEELQKMGERVAFYQGACDSLQEASKYLSSKQQKELADALAFTTDVVEGKRKAAKNENEFIYHEEVPDIASLQEVKGATLVKGIEFDINDPEVSGPDIFARLVPMEAHEAASVYSEKKAEILRNIGQQMEIRDQALVEFMSSMQLDLLTKMHQATGIPQELIDRAASLSAKPAAIQDLIDSMCMLSNICHDVEANLGDIDALLKEDEDNEKSYQEVMGKRPSSIITTDFAREASKYKEAHNKAKESNETLSKAVMTHLENLKILQRPIRELQQRLPSVELPNPNIDQNAVKELELLSSKVDEMKTQRVMLWAQLRDAIHNDDITNALVTKQPHEPLEEVFKTQMEKHNHLIEVLNQNLVAQDNIKKAFVDCYAKTVNTRRYIQDIIQKRSSTIQALIVSHDSYDDLLAKAVKGTEFYTKLDMNVSKLLQKIKSATKVQQEEREQMLAKNVPKKEEAPINPVSTTASAPKLKDYLEARKKAGAVTGYSTLPTNYGGLSHNVSDTQNWPLGVRPTPVGSEISTDPVPRMQNEAAVNAAYYQQQQLYQNYGQSGMSNKVAPNNYSSQQAATSEALEHLTNRMNALYAKQQDISSQYLYSSYTPQNYNPTPYTLQSQHYTDVQRAQTPTVHDASKASTLTTMSYQTISSYMPNAAQGNDTLTHMQYPDSTLQNPAPNTGYQNGAYNQATSYKPAAQPDSAPRSNQQRQYVQEQYPQEQYLQYQGAGNVQSAQTLPQPQQQVYSQQTQNPVEQGQKQLYMQQMGSSGYGTQFPTQVASSYGNAGNVPVSYGSNTQNPPVSAPQSYGVQAPTSTQPVATQNSASNPSAGLQSYSYQQYPSSGYSTNPQQSAQQAYFPKGYAPNYFNPVNASSLNTYEISRHNQGYYTQQHSSSVAPNTGTYSNYSTYSSPTGDPYKMQTGSIGASMSTGTSETGFPSSSAATSTTTNTQTPTDNSYGSVYGYNQLNYASTVATGSYTYPTSSPQVNSNTALQQNVPCNKESNIDLLTGLDFSATNNIPTLTPQSNIIVPEVRPEKKAVVENKTPKPSPKSSDQAINTPKVETIRVLPSKPLNNTEVKTLFAQEVEKFEKSVEALTSKTLSGPTSLDMKWKEIQDSQENDTQKRVISVARCYPMKNRSPDILPYDYSRVQLRTTGDDYINASFIKQISPFGPQFIVTQAPLVSTQGDFWAMVREQQVDLIFCLNNENEIGDEIYWPKEKGQTLSILNQNLVLSLQSVVMKPHWIERVISLTIPEKKETWNVLHLQFTSWPGSLFPTSPEPFLSIVVELISLFQQQKSVAHPILVHCSSGIGRSGLLCLLSNAILDVTNQSNSIPDLAGLTSQLGNFRKNILRDREHLKFAYESMLCYMKQLLSQDNLRKKLNDVVPVKESQEEAPIIPEVTEKTIDPLSTLDPFWASKK